MRKFLLLFFFVPCLLHAQNLLPTKDGKVFIEKVDTVNTVNKAELLKRSRIWVAKTFASYKAVEDVLDTSAGSLIGKGNFNYVNGALAQVTWTCKFTFQVDCKNERCRIRFFDVMDGSASGEWSAEYMNNRGNRKHVDRMAAGFQSMLDGYQKALTAPTDDNF